MLTSERGDNLLDKLKREDDQQAEPLVIKCGFVEGVWSARTAGHVTGSHWTYLRLL